MLQDTHRTKLAVTTPSESPAGGEGARITLDEEKKIALSQLQELEVAIKVRKVTKVDGRKIRWIEYRARKQAEEAKQGTQNKKRTRRAKSKSKGGENSENDANVVNNNNNNSKSESTMKVDMASTPLSVVGTNNVLESMKQQFLQGTESIDEPLTNGKTNLAETTVTTQKRKSGRTRRSVNTPEGTSPKNSTPKRLSPIENKGMQPQSGNEVKNTASANSSIIDTSLSIPNTPTTPLNSDPVALKKKFFAPKSLTKGLREVRKVENGVEGEVTVKLEDKSSPVSSPITTSVASLSLAALTPDVAEEMKTEPKTPEAKSCESKSTETKISCPLVKAAAKLLSLPSVRSRSADNTTKSKKVGAQKGVNKKVTMKAGGRSESEPRNVMNGHSEVLQNGSAEKGPSAKASSVNERATPNRSKVSKEDSPANTVEVESPVKRPRGRPPKRGLGVNKDGSTTAAGKSSKKLATVVVDVHNTMNGEPQTVIPVSRPVLRGKRTSPAKKSQKAATVLPEDTECSNIKDLSPSPKRPKSHEEIKSQVEKDQKDLLQIVPVQSTKKRKAATVKKDNAGKKDKESIQENKEENAKSSASLCNQTPVSPDKTQSTKVVKCVQKPSHQEVPALSELENPTAISTSLTSNKEQKISKQSPKVKPVQAKRKETSQDLAKSVMEKISPATGVNKDAESAPAQKSDTIQKIMSGQKARLIPKVISADKQIPGQKINSLPKVTAADSSVQKDSTLAKDSAVVKEGSLVKSNASSTLNMLEKTSSQKGDNLESDSFVEEDVVIQKSTTLPKANSLEEDISVQEIIPLLEDNSAEKDISVLAHSILTEADSSEKDTSAEESSILPEGKSTEKITLLRASSTLVKTKSTEKDTPLQVSNTLTKASSTRLDSIVQKNITLPKVVATEGNIPIEESSTLPKISSLEKDKSMQQGEDKCLQKDSLLPNDSSTNNNDPIQKSSTGLTDKGIFPVKESQVQKIIEVNQTPTGSLQLEDCPVQKLIVAQNNNELQNDDRIQKNSSQQRGILLKGNTNKKENRDHKITPLQKDHHIQKNSLAQKGLPVLKVTPSQTDNSPRIFSQKDRLDQSKTHVQKDRPVQRRTLAQKVNAPERESLIDSNKLTGGGDSDQVNSLAQKENPGGHKDSPSQKSSPKVKNAPVQAESVIQTDLVERGVHVQEIEKKVEFSSTINCPNDNEINQIKQVQGVKNICDLEQDVKIVQKDNMEDVIVKETPNLEKGLGIPKKAEIEVVDLEERVNTTHKESDEVQVISQAHKGKGKRQGNLVPAETSEQESQANISVKGSPAIVQKTKESGLCMKTPLIIEKGETKNKEKTNSQEVIKAPEASPALDKSSSPEVIEERGTRKPPVQNVLQEGRAVAGPCSTSTPLTEVPVTSVAKSKEKVPRILKQLFQDEGVQNMLKSMGEDSSIAPETSPNNDPGAHKLRPKRATEPMLAFSPDFEAMEALLTTKKKRRGTELDTLYMDEGVLNLLTSLEPHSRRSHQDDAASDTSQASSSRSVKGIKTSKSSLELNSESRKRKLSGASTVSNTSIRSMQPPDSKRARLESQDPSEDPYELAAAEEFQERPVSVEPIASDVDVSLTKKKGKPTLPLSVRQKNKAIRIQLKLQKQKQLKVTGSDVTPHKEDDNMNLAELQEVLRKAKETFNETPLGPTPAEKESDRSVPPLKIKLASDSVTIKPVSRPSPIQQIAMVDIGKQTRLPAKQNISDVPSRLISRPTPMQESRLTARNTMERPRPYPERQTPPPQLRRFDNISSPTAASFSSLVRTFDGSGHQRSRQRIGGESVRQSQRASVRQSEGNYHYRDISLRKFNNFTQIILSPSTTKMKNALNSRVLRELCEALNILKRDESVRMVLLTATGSTFCQGVDLTALQHHNIETRKKNAENLVRGIKDFLKALVQFPKPIVAGVNGNAMGLGVTMLPLFDLVIANDKAEFYLPYAKLGQVPEGGATYTFPNLFGKLQSTKLFLGHKITASKAQEMGLVSESIWPATYQQELIPKVALLATQSAQSMEATKALMNHHLVTKLELSLESECRLLLQQWTSPHFTHLCKRFLDSHHIHLQKPVNLPL
ncbi:nucleoporin nup211-like isoform X2 [Homarus americanus]|uniref:nucleoporin nup211-like isoform X2 n=1 Tax=Homarus americanus TaxID=6706 RepID=UPI001C46C439|nr:nucleoporin nup211-like isoform X2 [Homarus americanus]